MCTLCKQIKMSMEGFKVQDKFTSFEQLEDKANKYSKHYYADLHIRDSRLLDAAVKQKQCSSDRVKNRDYELKYVCKTIEDVDIED